MKKVYFFLFLITMFYNLSAEGYYYPPAIGPAVNTIAPTNMNILSVRGRGRITNTNGVNATNRGVVIYPYTDTDKVIGDINVTNFSEDGDFGVASYSLVCSGLSANTHYNIRAHATNPNGTGYGSRMDFWTLAKVPSAPLALNPGATTIDLIVEENGNPAGTEYCIREAGDLYVQANGSLGVTPYWQTALQWDTITVTGLTSGQIYNFNTRARNGIQTETINGPATEIICGTTIYVDLNATAGNNNGGNWADAFLTLQSALDIAVAGQQIWVAQGSYYPVNEIGGTGERYRTFQMVPGVAIYGGFDGTETLLNQRDFANNTTVLSGDIGVAGDSTDNCYHVFYHRTAYTPALDSTAVLDGFTVSDGNANAAGHPHNSGGGMYNYTHSPKIANCIFANNYGYFGGGIRNREASPVITDCDFSYNRADDGGGLSNYINSHAKVVRTSFFANLGQSGGAVQNTVSDPQFIDCVFEENNSTTVGGGVQNWYSGNPEFINCTFRANTAAQGGGAIFNDSLSNSVYINCLVANNSAAQYGGGILNHKCTTSLTNLTVAGNQAYYGGGITSDAANVTISNSIIWGNTGTVALQFANNGSTASIQYSCIPLNENDTASNPTSPGTLTLANNTEAYPKFFNPSVGDFSLYGNSPCVNSGNNAFNSTALEIRGNARIQNSTIDMGAFEWTSGTDSVQTHLIVYADSSKSGNMGDGFSWGQAKMSLQAALNLVTSGDQVWVKKGTYFPTSYHGLTPGYPADTRLKHFRMVQGVEVYGGLAGSETPPYSMDTREIAANPTILSGDINIAGDPSDNAYHVFYHPSGLGLTASAILDGFTIQGGNAGGSGIHAYGAGLHSNNNSPLLKNCTFSLNTASGRGGAAYINKGTPTFLNCNVVDNGADEGAGFYIESTAAVTMKTCNISDNQTTANAGGGFLVSTGSSLSVINSLIANNSSNSFGGGLYLHTGGSATFTNCTFSKNHAAYGGGAYTNGTSLIFNNSILWGNTSSQWGNQIETTGSAGTVLNYSCYSNIYDNAMGIWDVEGNVAATACITENPGFVDADLDLFMIKGNSPCVDAGLSTYNAEPMDLRNETRIQGASIDMGAYEFTSGTDPDKGDLFVKHNATGGNNGTDWTNAYTSLQSALNKPLIPGDAIWVAKGTYYPSYDYNMGSGRFNHFRMIPGVRIIGGLAGNEDVQTLDLNTRDLWFDETRLSGNPGSDGDTSNNCYHLFYHPDGLGLDTTAILDGFTIMEGIATGENDEARGGAMFNRNNHPTLKNCMIRDNYALNDGGGIYNDGSSPNVFHCYFVFDSCRYSGGAIYNRNGSNPVIVNSLFGRNAGIYGGALYCQSSNPLINNCTFAGNNSYIGGGLLAEGGDASTITINNSIFWGNTGWSLEGQQIYVKESASVIINNSCYSNEPGDIYNDAVFGPTNCITSYPGFSNPDIGDLRLASCSPCVDAGNNAALHTSLDLRGEDRIQNAVIDMGAYEYTAGTDPFEVRAVSGSLTRTPDQDHVCMGTEVSASLTPGSGGNEKDTCQYRTSDGTGWSAWMGYEPNDLISTTGKTRVVVRTYRDSDYGVIGAYDTVFWVMDSLTLGGDLSGGVHVCTGTNSTLLSLSGQRGSVDSWQYSTDQGDTWNDVAGATETTYTAENLTMTTYFRVVVINGECPEAWSTVDSVVVDPASAGGTVSGGTTVCPGTNSTELSLTGQTGDVIKWQYQVISDTPGPSWIDIGSSSTTTYTATNLSVATKYRVVVKSGQCASAYSSEETIDTETPPVSGTLTKSPNVANVCDGNDVSATLTPGSGGNLTDITEYRTKSGGSWGSWTAYTPGNAITTTGVTNVEIQTYREAEYCNDAAPNTVSWTIDPPTNAGAVTGGVPVCYGTNSTLLTLAGHSGTVQKWQYSTDNTNWTDIASHTQTTYTAVNLTQDTWYRAVVKSGDCLPANSGATEITVMSDFKISGFAKYENNPKTALDGLKITLKQGSTPVGSPVITGSTGYYEFSGLPNGTYDLTVESANSGGWLTWGGVNNTDYLLVSRHIAGTQYLPVNPPVVQITASVKLPHPAINNVDATAIRQAAKFPTTGFSYFDIPKWVFSGTTGATALTGITVSCSDVTRDIRGLCAGDVNGTYVPPSGYKTVPNQIHLVQKGTMPLNSEVTFPVSVTQSLELGAITLMLDYNPSALEITGIEMPVNGGIDPWFTVDEGVLLIGWWSLDPVKISRGDILLLVHARKVQDFSSSEQVYFALNQNPVSELADGRGEIISDVTLEIPSAGLKNSVAAAREEIVLTVYPNPATERLNVEYLLPEDAALSFELMDARGITFTLRSSESKMAGSGKESFNIDGLTPGVYMLKLKAGATVILRKVIVRP